MLLRAVLLLLVLMLVLLQTATVTGYISGHKSRPMKCASIYRLLQLQTATVTGYISGHKSRPMKCASIFSIGCQVWLLPCLRRRCKFVDMIEIWARYAGSLPKCAKSTVLINFTRHVTSPIQYQTIFRSSPNSISI